MVSNVSFNGNSNWVLPTYDAEETLKYAVGTNLTNKEDSPFDNMGLMFAFTGGVEALKFGKWALNNKNDLSNALKADGAKIKENFIFEKEALKGDGWKSPESYKNIYTNAKVENACFKAEEAIAKLEREKASIEAGKFSFLNRAQSKITGKSVEEVAAKRIEKLTVKAEEATKSAQIVAGVIDAEKLTAGAKILKCVKGNGLFLAISGISELFTQVIPSFTQLGTNAGMKQLGKSVVKTAASAGGWVAGAAVGAAIGSVIPVAGTAVGAVVGGILGFVGGCIGAWLAEKAATAVVGKDELEIAEEKKAAQQQATQQEDAQQNSQTGQYDPSIAGLLGNGSLGIPSISSNPFDNAFEEQKIMMLLQSHNI